MVPANICVANVALIVASVVAVVTAVVDKV
jgi:hypothetical protein